MAQRKVKASTYIKNVGKSFGYAVGDVFAEYNPTVAAITKGTKSAYNDIRRSMREMKNNSISKAAKDFTSSQNFITNVLDDLSTGKWYNKDRETDNIMSDMGLDGDDWGDDFGSSDTSSVDSLEETSVNNTRSTISAITSTSESLANAMVESTTASAKYIAQSQNAASRAIYDMTAHGFNQVSNILLNMNTQLVAMQEFSKPAITHFENSSIFYTKTTDSLNKISSSLDILVKRTAYLDQPVKKRTNDKSSSRFISGNDFDMESYVDMVKENINDMKEMASSFTEMGKMMAGKNGKNISLVKMGMNAGLKALIPSVMKETMKEVNQSLNDAIITGLSLGGKKAAKSDNLLVNLLGSVFLPKNEDLRTNVSSRKYNKGPMPWDGVSKKALTEVIPTYLAKIYAAVGGEEKYFDYEIGKFVTTDDINRKRKYEIKSAAERAGGDFYKEAKNRANERGLSDEVKAEIDNYFMEALKRGEGFNEIRSKGKNRDWQKDFGVSDKSVELLLELMDLADQVAVNGKIGNKYKNMYSKFGSGVFKEQKRLNKLFADEEEKGSSIYNNLVNNGPGYIKNSSLNQQTEYLKGIYNMVGNIYASVGLSRSAKNGRKTKMVNVFNESTGKIDIATINRTNAYNARISSGNNVTAGERASMNNSGDMLDPKYWGMSEDEIRRSKSEAAKKKKISDTKDNINGLINEALDPEKAAKGKGAAVLSFIRQPFNMISTALGNLSTGINNIFWGSEDHPGILDTMQKKLTDFWDKTTTSIKDFVKDKTSPFREKMKEKGSDLFNRSIGDAMKEEWSSIKDKAAKRWTETKNKTKQAIDEFNDAKLEANLYSGRTTLYKNGKYYYYKKGDKKVLLKGDLLKRILTNGVKVVDKTKYNPDDTVDTHAFGARQIRRTGLAVLSEGELVIPSELNPFYTGYTDKRQEIRNENRIRNRFLRNLPGYAEGNFEQYGNVSKEVDANGNITYYKEYTDKDGKKRRVNINEAQYRLGVANDRIREGREKLASSSIAGTAVAGADTLLSGVRKFLEDSIFGQGDEAKKQKKKVFDSITDVFKEMGEDKGAMGIGAIAGTGVSLLTGAVVGPLAGAAIGAGAGLLFKSEKVQEALFGKPDENGNYEKPIGNFVMKQLPNMATGAGVGAAAGTLLGSPVLGAIVGSAIGFGKSSDFVKDFLFGKAITDEQGNIIGRSGGKISKDLQMRVKKAAPNIAAGVLAGAIAGPFGMVGNILLGSGLGYLSTSDRFHEWMFGKEGLTSQIHNKIIKNIDGIFGNLKNSIKGFTKRIGKSISRKVSGMFSGIRKQFDELIKGTKVETIAKFVAKFNPVNAVGNVLGGVNKGIKKRNLKRGYDVYDEKLGRNLTAAEKIEYRKNNYKKGDYSKDSYYRFDEELAGIESEEDLNSIKNTIQEIADNKINTRKKNKASLDKRLETLKSMGVPAKLINQLGEAIVEGNVKKRERIINKIATYMKNDSDLEKMNNLISSATNEVNANNTESINTNAKYLDLMNRGIIDKNTNLDTLLESIESERSRFTEESKLEAKENSYKSNIIGILSHVDEILSDLRDQNPYLVNGEWNKAVQKTLKKELKKEIGTDTQRTLDDIMDSNTVDMPNDPALRQPGATFTSGDKYYKVGKDGTPTEISKDQFIDEKRFANKDKLQAMHEKKMSKLAPIMHDRDDEGNIISEAYAGGYRRGLTVLSKGELVIPGYAEGGAGKKSFMDILSSKIAGKFGITDDMDGDGAKDNVVSQIDSLGNVHQYTKNNQGELTEVTNDKETIKSRKTMTQLTDSINKIPLISSGLLGLKGLLGSLKTSLVGEDDDNKGLSLEDLMSGKGKGLLGALIGGLGKGLGIIGLTTAALTGKFDDIFARMSAPGTVLGGNDTASTIDDNTSYVVTLKDGTEIHVTKDKDGNYIDSEGNIIDPADIKSIKKLGSDTRLSTMMKKNLLIKGPGSTVAKLYKMGGKKVAKGLKAGGKIVGAAKNTGKKIIKGVKKKVSNITETGSKVINFGKKVGGKIIEKGKSKAAKAIDAAKDFGTKGITKGKNLLSGAKNGLAKKATSVVDGLKNLKPIKKIAEKKATKNSVAALKAAENAVDASLKSSVIAKVSEALGKIPEVLKKIPALKNSKMIATASEWIKTLGKNFDNIIKTASKDGLKGASKALGKIFWAITIAYAVSAGIDAFTGGASTILGITGEATLGEKCIATIIAVIQQLIPVVDLFPTKVLVNIFMDIAAKFDWDEGSGAIAQLAAKRESAHDEVDAYNKANNTDLSIEEYNDMEIKDANGKVIKKSQKGWISKVGDGIGDGFRNLTKGFKKKKKDKKSGSGSGLPLISGGSSFNSEYEVDDIKKKYSRANIVNKVSSAVKREIAKYQDAIADSDILDQVQNRLMNAGYIDTKTDLTSLVGTMTRNGRINVPAVASKIKNKISSTARTLIQKTAQKVSGVVNTVKGFFGFGNNSGTGAGLDPYSGGSSGFVSQYDPRYKGLSIAGDNFADKGCGPAVASMIGSSLGKNIPVESAVSASKRYQNSNGVSIDYFRDVLGKNGIDSEIIAGGGAGDIYNKILSGNKVALLGRDPYNTSKADSPFGPNNHYVLATGVDRKGNVIVNDPELSGPRAYSPSILKSASFGISSKERKLISGGAGSVKAQVWYYLMKNGFTEQAAAGIMGNFQQETNFNPSLKNNVTQGIACWDKQDGVFPLEAAAKKSGKNWQDLGFQLDYLMAGLPKTFETYTGRAPHYYKTGEWCWWPKKMSFEQFKKLTSINDAAEIFCRVYERASKPMISKRQQYANECYKEFTGKEGEPVTYSGPGSVAGFDGSSNGVSDGGSNGGGFDPSSLSIKSLIGNGIGGIGDLFANAFGAITGSTGTSAGYNGVGGVTGDGVTSNPDLANFTSNSPIEWMQKVKGTLKYSMSGPRNPDAGSSDCSSTVRWAIKKAGGPDIGGSTPEQYSNSNLADVWYNNGGYCSKLPDNIQPNDVLFFSRPTSDYTKGRKDRVGHIELYEGNGKMIGHGGGMGPKEKDVPLGSSGKLIKISRVKTSGKGSGLDIRSYEDLARVSGGSSGILIGSRAGAGSVTKKAPTNIMTSNTAKLSPMIQPTSMIKHESVSAKTPVSNNGNVSKDTVLKLVDSIGNILNSIAKNTVPVEKIYELLAEYIKNGGSMSNTNTTETNSRPSPKSSNVKTNNVPDQEIDANIHALAETLAALAKG